MRKVISQLRQYKKDTFLCIGLTALEVVMEILLPFITAKIIDEGLQAGNMPAIYRYGALMIVMAFFSLFHAHRRTNPARIRRLILCNKQTLENIQIGRNRICIDIFVFHGPDIFHQRLIGHRSTFISRKRT